MAVSLPPLARRSAPHPTKVQHHRLQTLSRTPMRSTCSASQPTTASRPTSPPYLETAHCATVSTLPMLWLRSDSLLQATTSLRLKTSPRCRTLRLLKTVTKTWQHTGLSIEVSNRYNLDNYKILASNPTIALGIPSPCLIYHVLRYLNCIFLSAFSESTTSRL